MPIKGGRRTEEERATAKCHGAVDFFSQDLIDDPMYAIRIKEGGHYYCFDVRSLINWFNTGKRTNPLTGLQFSDEGIAKIMKKISKVGMKLDDPNHKIVDEDVELLDIIQYSNRGPLNIRVLKHNYEEIDVEAANYELLSYVGDRNYDMVLCFGDSTVYIFTLRQRTFDTIVEQLSAHVGRAPDNIVPAYSEWEF